MTPSRGIHTPNILLRFPPGSLCVWTRAQTVRTKGKGYAVRHDHVLARVVDRSKRQGNSRLVLDVLFIGRDAIGENVLYVKRMSNVRIENVMSLTQWRKQVKA